MDKKYVLALDQGTTSSRAIVFDHEGKVAATAQREFKQYFPEAGWVEHDANEIWTSQAGVVAEAISKVGANGNNRAGIGLTNKRDTTLPCDRDLVDTIPRTTVWRDRLKSEYCDQRLVEVYAINIPKKTVITIES